MRKFLLSMIAALGVVAVLLGVVSPAMAVPCAAAATSDRDATCPCCDSMALIGGAACAQACQPGALAARPVPKPPLGESAAWFAMLAPRIQGLKAEPSEPPPR